MTEQAKPTWRFPRFFWAANLAELFERAAYYAVFIGLAVYLTREYGFSDVGAGWVGGYFAGLIYFLPAFAGALADRMGFRLSLALAYALLTVGYLLLGVFGLGAVRPMLGLGGVQAGALLGLTVIAVGGAFVKSVIGGTVARASDETSRARAFSIFYLVVNVGSFIGKTVAKPLRTELGLQYVSFYAAIMGLLGLAAVLLFYRGIDSPGEGKSLREIGRAFLRVLRNGRFLGLMLIVAGFWTIQGQLYAAMPKYVLRTVGEGSSPEWLANVNPLVVMIFVLPVTQIVRRLSAVTSIGIALAIIPLSALLVSLSPVLEGWTGREIDLLGMAVHPITVTLVAGIAVQGLAECFLSPRYLEFASRQAPKGEEGLYMGFSHLHTVIAWPLGFILSGYLLDAWCPDPKTLPADQLAAWKHALQTGGELPAAYAHAHYLWYVFAAIGVVSFLMLLVYQAVVRRLDRKTAGQGA